MALKYGSARRVRRSALCVMAFAALLGSGQAVSAQEEAGILGQVTDESGGTLPG